MWECPSVAFVDLIFFFFFGRRTVLGFDACHLFPQHMLAIFPLMGVCSCVGVWHVHSPGRHLAPSHGWFGSGGEPGILQGRWGKWPASTHSTLGDGSGICPCLPLGSEVAASAYTYPWSSCRQYPATSEYTDKEAPMGACPSTWVPPTMRS